MLGRVLDWVGLGDGDGDGDADAAIDWTDPDAEYGGDGPIRRHTCPECGARIEGRGPDEQVACPDCATVFKGTLTPDYAVCPTCDARVDDVSFYPETRRDSEYANCSACGYRWASDPR